MQSSFCSLPKHPWEWLRALQEALWDTNLTSRLDTDALIFKELVTEEQGFQRSVILKIILSIVTQSVTLQIGGQHSN